MRRSRVLYMLATGALVACGGGGGPSEAAPTDRLPLGSAVLKLEASPYHNRMPGPPSDGPCQNFIVPVALAPVEGLLPSGIVFGAVSLSVNGEQIWRAPVGEQRIEGGKVVGVARGCANARTVAGRDVRVLAEVSQGGAHRTVYTDATITEAF